MGGMPGNSGPYPVPTRCRDPNQMSVSLEHSAFASQKVWREWLLPHPGPLRHQQCSDHHPSSGPKPLHSPGSLTCSGKLVHRPWPQGHILLPPAVSNQPALVCRWVGRPTHWDKDTAALDSPATRLQKLTYPVWWSPGCGSCCLSQGASRLRPAPVRACPAASQSQPRGLLERRQSPVGSAVHHRAQGVLEKGSDLQTGGQVPGACHLKMASGTSTWEEASHLFNTSAEHQQRRLWAPQGCRILPDLDTGFLWNCQAFV